MDIIIPASNSGTDELITSLTSERWGQLASAMTTDSVVLSMPKWKFEYKTSLNNSLNNMGMTDLFVDGLADLTGINS